MMRPGSQGATRAARQRKELFSAEDLTLQWREMRKTVRGLGEGSCRCRRGVVWHAACMRGQGRQHEPLPPPPVPPDGCRSTCRSVCRRRLV